MFEQHEFVVSKVWTKHRLFFLLIQGYTYNQGLKLGIILSGSHIWIVGHSLAPGLEKLKKCTQLARNNGQNHVGITLRHPTHTTLSSGDGKSVPAALLLEIHQESSDIKSLPFYFFLVERDFLFHFRSLGYLFYTVCTGLLYTTSAVIFVSLTMLPFIFVTDKYLCFLCGFVAAVEELFDMCKPSPAMRLLIRIWISNRAGKINFSLSVGNRDISLLIFFK